MLACMCVCFIISNEFISSMIDIVLYALRSVNARAWARTIVHACAVYLLDKQHASAAGTAQVRCTHAPQTFYSMFMCVCIDVYSTLYCAAIVHIYTHNMCGIDAVFFVYTRSCVIIVGSCKTHDEMHCACIGAVFVSACVCFCVAFRLLCACSLMPHTLCAL